MKRIIEGKIFSQMHLANWHYIEFETIQLHHGINYFTGETGSGKSTVIDALQLLILGDVRGSSFNKAANKDSKRSLIWYLRGKRGDGDSHEDYLRFEKDFISTLVLEVVDTKNKNTFCIGAVFEVRKNSDDFEYRFFHFNGALPGHKFRDMTWLAIQQMYKNQITIHGYEDYRTNFRNKYMGMLRKEFFDIFRRAVALDTTKDIKEFMRKFVCDEIYIDVDSMKQSIRALKSIEKEMKIILDKIKHLEEINAAYSTWKGIDEQRNKEQFILDRCGIELINNEILSKIDKVKINEETIYKNNISIENLKQERAKLERQKTEIEDKILMSGEGNLENKIEELANRIDDYKRQEGRYIADAVSFERWIECLENYYNLFGEELNDLSILLQDIRKIRSYEITEEALSSVNTILVNLKERLNDDYIKDNHSYKELKEQRKFHNEEIKKLEEGFKGYPSHVVNLQNAIKQNLKSKYCKEIEVNVLADLLDVKDKSWLNAIEGYMNTQKLNLIIDPAYYQDAIEIYNSLDKNKFYGVGIVDIENISKQKIQVDENSLVDELITDSNYVRIYINYLLGRVKKCESIKELRKYKIAITKGCFLYKSFIARQLNPDSYNQMNSFIGKETILNKIKVHKNMLLDINTQIVNIEAKLRLLDRYRNLNILTPNNIEDMIDKKEKILSIPNLEAERKKFIETLQNMLVTYLQDLKDDKEKITKRIINIDAEKDNINDQTNQYITSIWILKNDILYKEKSMKEKNNKLLSDYGEEFIEREGKSYFTEMFSKYRYLSSLIKEFEYLIENETKPKVERLFEHLKSKRENYRDKFIVHWDITNTSNEVYERAFNDLVTTELQRFSAKLEKQKERAFQEFKEDLLYKLRDGINKTETNITFLNRAIAELSFGQKKYKFKVKGASAYQELYDMLTDPLLVDAGPLVFMEFEKRYKEQIDELFTLISDENESMEKVKANIEKYTDYRTYLDFDMEEEFDGVKSKISKSIYTNSGGESQSPYFIAVLASFLFVYRMHSKDKDDTMRLMVLDEAFNKMDDEHIRMSLNLMKQRGFQAIIAAPVQQIPIIGPEVDKIFFYVNQGKKNIDITEFEGEDKDELFLA